MSRWVIKWNRNDRPTPGVQRDWDVALSSTKTIECYGKADGLPSLGSLSAGNVALAYQADDRTLCGIVRVLSVQASAREPYVRAERVHRFEKPVRLAAIMAATPALVGVEAFAAGALHSMRRLSPDEFRLLLAGCGVDAAMRAKLNV